MELVTCSNCYHTFPINPNKHRNRKERYCPRCKTPLEKRGWFDKKWKPNKEWLRKREEEQKVREQVRKAKEPTIRPLPPMSMLLASIIARRELEKEERRAS